MWTPVEHVGVAEVGECPNDRVLRCHRDVAQLGHGALAEPCERGAVEPERAQAVVERVNEAGDIQEISGCRRGARLPSFVRDGAMLEPFLILCTLD